MEQIHLTIDGQTITANAGQSVLEAALAAGIYIPHICTHPDLPVQANCKLCVVEIEGLNAPVCSCETQARDGMAVTTRSEDLTHRRGVAMELMLAGHPHDCTGCKMYLKCELQAMMQYLGSVHSRMRSVHRKTNAINVKNPIIVREMERCIQCGRCVRACHKLRDVGVIDYKKMDAETYIGTERDLPLTDAGCRFCGACVEVCPTGALQDAEGLFRADLPREQALVPCQAECPAHIDIPAYIRAVQEGNCSGAVAVIREKVPFPHALGLVCNNRCEGGCKRGALNSPISIRNLKRYAVEHDSAQPWKPQYLAAAPRTGKRVAVIGGGACGLTAAYYLNKKGHDVTVFEAKPIAGGHMTSGMPEYRIPTQAVMDEIRVITDSGVKLICNHPVDNAAGLKKDYDAVLVAVGTSVGKKLTNLPGSDLGQVYSALEVLQAQRLGTPIDLGGAVCIIGGGNVAFDAAGTLIRMGKAVRVVCLEENASQASPEERDAAIEEGAELLDRCSSEAILSAGGKVTGLRAHRIGEFHFDPDTHALVETPIPDSTFEIPCDSIVFAAGQVTGLTDAFGLELNRFGYPIDPAAGTSGYRTSAEGVFAAGDVITGTRFLIDAIAGARDVAGLMDQYLGGDGVIDETLAPRTRPPELGKAEGFASAARSEPAARPAARRREDFLPIAEGLTCEQAACESGRCLQCDLRKDIQRVKMWPEYSNR